MGRVMTSSPTSPTTPRPSGSNTSTAAPSARHCISPARTGSHGEVCTNAVHRSVPPLTLASSRSAPTASYTQAKPSGDSGAPVEPTVRTDDRSATSRGTRPADMQEERYGAEVPKTVSRSLSASRHSAPRSGKPGEPSYITTVEPTSRPPTR